MLLKASEPDRASVEADIKALYSLLLNSDVDTAAQYTNWVLKKFRANGRHRAERIAKASIKRMQPWDPAYSQLETEIARLQHRNFPRQLNKGDIIHVDFGVGFCDELSKGHYGIVLSRLYEMYLVAPLTKTPQRYGVNNMELHGLGLPGRLPDDISYVNFTQVRYVHRRRIENIDGVTGGVKHLSQEEADEVLDKFYKIVKSSPV